MRPAVGLQFAVFLSVQRRPSGIDNQSCKLSATPNAVTAILDHDQGVAHLGWKDVRRDQLMDSVAIVFPQLDRLE